MAEIILELVQQVKSFSMEDKSRLVHEFFEANKTEEGVIVLDGIRPAGIIMRPDFYQKMGQQYGYNLFYNRPVSIMMKQEMLSVDPGMSLARLGVLAMGRSNENLYDFILVNDGEEFAGVVSIRAYLIEMSNTKEREIELLKRQRELLTESNEKERGYREHVESMNRDLHERHSAIRSLLDNAGQGFLNIEPDGSVSREYSRECLGIFASQIEGRQFVDVLRSHMTQDACDMAQEALLGAFMETDGFKREVYLSLLPAEIAINGKTVRFEFKPVTDGEAMRVLVIMTDITEKKALEARMNEEKANIRLILRVVSGKADIRRAIDDWTEFSTSIYAGLAGGAETRLDLASLYRVVHTFKGDFAQLGMRHASRKLHVLEDKLSGLMESGCTCADDIVRMMGGFAGESIVEEDLAVIAQALGTGFLKEAETISIDSERLGGIERAVLAAISPKEREVVRPLLESIRHASLMKEIEKCSQYLITLAESMAKQLEPIRCVGEDVYVDGNRFHQLIKSLVHIFRNSLDHGIEAPDERENAGKDLAGLITCAIASKDGSIELAISDDGRGVDAGAIRLKAVEKGVLTDQDTTGLDEESSFGLLFVNGFSTKQGVTELSGRGVGLSAVKAEVERLGGTISVSSKVGQGTCFTIRIA